MIRYLNFISILIFAIAVMTSTAEAVWRLDGLDLTQVRNFRVTSSTTSASAQPSLKSLPLLYDVLKSETLSKTPIYIVDLRQESHGFANGVPVSWYEEHNHANFGKSVNEIDQDEVDKLKSILGKQTEFLPLGKHDEAAFSKLTMLIDNVQNERHAAESTGFKYIRFAAADMVFPDPAVVDDFIKFYLSLPQKHWLHFHCHAGHGRTTTFLVFYDILTYPDLSLEEIVQRQHSLGGSDLLAVGGGDDWYSEKNRERAEKLRQFYRYVKEERASNFTISWNDWLKDK
ncbi:MAG: protein tyrosine phosphatase [Selenomonadaceae bacterium]|nr:protein tyrosine phosphatase [Selenomonadaceae bacterium]